jgi:putative ABC transport system permease protein
VTTSNGGVAARRAVVRWAARMFRREWRQQLLVLALITVAVAAAILSAAAAYNVTPSNNGEVGSADRRIQLRPDRTSSLAADIAAINQWTGPVDVIGHRPVAVPGSVEMVDLRAMEPGGRLSGSLLALRQGRYPRAPGEFALSDGTARLLDVGVGSTFVFDGRQRTVVGLVENPSDLDDEFALVAPGHADVPESVDVLARGGGEGQGLPAELQSRVRPERIGATEKTTGAVLVLALSTVVLLLIGLVAAAGFVVIAQRRLRQLGMLAAIGATDRHLRLVVLANGVLVGAVAAVLGAALGLLGWVALAPRLEEPAGHRIATFDVPWWVVAVGMALAVATATAAAWWPARAMARVPITEALSARPPRPKPARRSAVAAVLLLAAGFACLAVGIDSTKDEANPALVIGGILAIVLGVLFASPLAIRVLAATAGRLPVAGRLALRDLARHQARSGAALAAISLGLGIAVAIVVIATAAAPTAAEGNLSTRQVLLRAVRSDGPGEAVPDHTSAELVTMRSEVERIAAGLDAPTVIALEAVVDPTSRETTRGQVVRPAVALAWQVSPHTFRDAGRLYVASPAVLRRLDIDPQDIQPDTDVLVTRREVHRVIVPSKGPNAFREAVKVQVIDAPPYSSMPTVLMTPEGLRRRGLAPMAVGWLVESPTPFTDAQLAGARHRAAHTGLTVEARQSQSDLTVTRLAATGAGMLLALGVLAMTVGLVRGESARDLRTLAATGATSTTRRTLTAVTAGALGLLGAVLGIGGAYLAIVAGYFEDLSSLRQVPVLELVVTLLGVPFIAVIASWLMAGSEPVSLARAALD